MNTKQATFVKPLPPIVELREMLHYLPEDGSITRKAGRYKGQKAGYVNNSNGYLRLKIKATVYEYGRIAWALYYGEDPCQMLVDHIDRNPLNNRIENLRLVTKAGNNRNTKLRKDNTSGAKGVTYRRKTSKYIAQINVDRVKIHIGCYDTVGEAARAAAVARAFYHGKHASHGTF